MWLLFCSPPKLLRKPTLWKKGRTMIPRETLAFVERDQQRFEKSKERRKNEPPRCPLKNSAGSSENSSISSSVRQTRGKTNLAISWGTWGFSSAHVATGLILFPEKQTSQLPLLSSIKKERKSTNHSSKKLKVNPTTFLGTQRPAIKCSTTPK